MTKIFDVCNCDGEDDGDDDDYGGAGDDYDGAGDGQGGETDRLKAVLCAVRQWLRFQLHREAGAAKDRSKLESKKLGLG